MERSTISDMILQNEMVLYGQPKWTFGKNTCNTYEVFVSYFRRHDGNLLPAWPILEIIEKDDALTMLFSISLLWDAVRKTVELSNRANSNLTLSLNVLPAFAESPNFVEQVKNCLAETGLPPRKLQFEISELQELSAEGCENLNYLHDEMGILLCMGNFGTHHTNMPLLHQVHFDMLELDKSYAALIPGNESACKAAVAIQHMADTLDMKMCAKGIENQDQFEFFEEIGAYKGQGALIGNPMTMEELEAYAKQYALEKGHK
ncbi:MAG: EAL domain-containing protein [Clostridia bacterium]|nr:EAL domain-containing protein [Clostridia bacterium]